jgi:hypothetical protein
MLGRRYETSSKILSSSSIFRPQFGNKTYLKPGRLPKRYIAGIGYAIGKNFVIQ